MILVDINQILYSALFKTPGLRLDTIDIDLFRHITLNMLRTIRVKFHEEYGELILCRDSKSNWRYKIFPHYKAKRKTDRQKSDFDWNVIFNMMSVVCDELKENFPYPFIQIDQTEADDIIYTLCKYNANDKILVVSGDNDFIQLQTNKNIKQYNPIQKKFVKENNPTEYLFDHIVHGDSGDGVPNILSDDDTFVISGKRQTPITKKKFDIIKNDKNILSDPKFIRNKSLIDLSEIPQYIQDGIIQEYNKNINNPVGRSKVFDYMIANKMTVLLDSIQQF